MNLLSLEHVRTFVTVADTLSYTRAAERLYRTQSAISQQMQKLEDQLGASLFERNGRQTTLTEAGRTLLPYARQLLDMNQEAIGKMAVVESSGLVRVGVLEEVTFGPLVQLLSRFGKLAANIQLELTVATSSDLAEAIAANRLDLAVANTRFDPDGTTPLWNERYVWAASDNFEVDRNAPLPLLMDPPGSSCMARASAVSHLEAAGTPWTLVLASDSMAALQAAVRAGLGIGLLAESAVRADMRILGTSDGLPDLPESTIGIYRAGDAASTAVESLHDFMVTHLQVLSPGS